MSDDIQAIAKRFIASLNTDPRFHSVKIRNVWAADGSPVQEIHISVRGGFNPDLPPDFEGVAVKRVPWPKDR